MSTLVITTAALPGHGHNDGRAITHAIVRALVGTSTEAVAQAVVLAPASVVLDVLLFAKVYPYAEAIGLEKHPEAWRHLLDERFEEIVVLGVDPATDVEEIVLACYLPAARRTYVGVGGRRDIAEWRAQVKPDLAPRGTVLRRLGPEQRLAYLQTAHGWLVEQLAGAALGPPTTVTARSPENQGYYFAPRLAADLAQHTLDLQHEAFGRSFSTLMCLDGSLVHTADYYRALANFILAVDGIDSVLDVGCGSGLLASHLAASGRYRSVMGVDGSPQRVAAARLHAELNGAPPVRFETMSVAALALPDRSVDVSVTSFALEQTGAHLERCFAEIRRVTRKLMILIEPTTEFFPTLASLWHVPLWGWANQYHEVLVKSGLAFATRPMLLTHYYNPATVFVVDLESREHPRLRHPQLFGLRCEDWPGGVTFV